MELQVFRNSKLSIDWMSGFALLDNSDLQVLGQRLKIIADSFSSISFQHVFREMNVEANRVSKEALELPEFHLIQEEFLDGEIISIRDDDIF